MTIEELYKEIPSDSPINQIVEDIFFSEAIPEDNKLEVLYSALKGKTDLIDEITKYSPDIFKEINKSKGDMAGKSISNSKALAGILGYSSVEAMLDKRTGWESLPGVSVIGAFRDAGVDPYEAMRSLAKHQIERDRKMIVKGADPETGERGFFDAAQYLARTAVAPRTMEALEAGEEPGVREIGMDLGENALFTVPFGRALGFIPKIKKAGNAVNSAIRGGKEVLANAIAPAISETADYLAYDPEENYHRGTFSPGAIALGTLVNLGTAPSVAGTVSSLTRRSTIPGANRGQALDFLVSDPVLENRLVREELEGVAAASNPAANLQRQVDEQIVSKVLKNEKARSRMSKEQLEEYRKWLNNEGKGSDTETKRSKINKLIDLIPDENIRMAYKKMYNETNPSHVWPTQLLGEDAKKYGLTDSKELAFVHQGPKEDIPVVKIRAEHGLSLPVVSSEKSAAKLSEEAKKGHTDPKYPRATDFDRKVEELLKDPNVIRQAKYGTGFRSGLAGVMGKNLLTNKLGRDKYGQNLVANAIEEDYTNAEIQDILNDDFIIRQWKAGFVPRGGVEKVAYEIAKSKGMLENKE